MPHMYSVDVTYHATQDNIYSLHNPSNASPLEILVNEHKEVLKTLSEILRKKKNPAVPPRVPVG